MAGFSLKIGEKEQPLAWHFGHAGSQYPTYCSLKSGCWQHVDWSISSNNGPELMWPQQCYELTYQSCFGKSFGEAKVMLCKVQNMENFFSSCLVSRIKFQLVIFHSISPKDRNYCTMLNRKSEETTGFRKLWGLLSCLSYCFSWKHCPLKSLSRITLSLKEVAITSLVLTPPRNYLIRFFVVWFLSFPSTSFPRHRNEQ